MRWTIQSINSYLKEREYVDTAVIPLVPVSWEKDIKATVEAGEFAALLVDGLEQQLRGRVIHFPPFSYLKAESLELRVDRLLQWKRELLENGFKHVYFITSDAEWKGVEEQIGDSLIWLPAVPLEYMSQENSQEILSSQIKQLLQIIMMKWQNS
ncbi:MAG TPA: YpiF family protein [Bacillales bacterium]|nr:YpiF family protein [Bacillales bacterium]